ncbi:MAG: HupE/UreJ family protein [Verrucomicrobiales bacterium]|nr:HupE/UreJ family protein [Verrucomicrobiales bacterium]MCP5528112.1 HupE/UreJ family protein [Verrucomicrobiales bacterium]
MVSVLATLAFPVLARAHLVNSGLGPFYDGVTHLALSPDELLGIVGLALLAGLGGAAFGRMALFTLPLAWLAGGLLGMTGRITVNLPTATGLALIVIGTLVALDRQVPFAIRPVIVGGFGLVEGLQNGAVAATGALPAGGLLGIAATAFVLVALVAAGAVAIGKQPPWTRIVARVAGSWIAAIGLLMTGWALR